MNLKKEFCWILSLSFNRIKGEEEVYNRQQRKKKIENEEEEEGGKN